MRLAVLLIAVAASATAGEFRHRLSGATLDVYVGASIETPADAPGAPPAENHLIVSVKTLDGMAQAVMVSIMVRLDDKSRISRTAVLRRLPGEDWVVFRLPIGERRPSELVDIRVDNLRKTFADALIPVL